MIDGELGASALRSMTQVLLPAAVIVLVGRWRALNSWSNLFLRHARAGVCWSCGYDRSGLAANSVCPECGGAASA